MNRFYFLILVFLPLNILSQNVRDVVFLKDKSEIRGEIIERTESVVRIKTMGDNIFAFTPDEISRIESEEYEAPTQRKVKGYYNYTTMGLLAGPQDNELETPFSLLMEHSFHINQYFAIGGLSGIELLNETTVPLALNIKGVLPINNDNYLFLGASAGYSFSLEKPSLDNWTVKEATGGLLVNPELGIVFTSESNVGFVASIGYRYNTLNYLREDWWAEEVERKITFNRISLRFGIVFY